MTFNVDKEYHDIAGDLYKRIPFLELGVPSMYSKDGRHLYLQSLGECVGADYNDFDDVKATFLDIVEHRRKGVHANPLSSKLQKEYQLAWDQELLARWIRDHFEEQSDFELDGILDYEPEAND